MPKKRKVDLERVLNISKEVFSENNIPFEIKNNGYHIIIRTGGNRYDFWPTSGKFMVNNDFKVQSGGITKLVEKISEDRYMEKKEDNLDAIFSKDLNDMTRSELISTIELLCDFINRKIKTCSK